MGPSLWILISMDPVVLRADLDGPSRLEVVEQLNRRAGRQDAA